MTIEVTFKWSRGIRREMGEHTRESRFNTRHSGTCSQVKDISSVLHNVVECRYGPKKGRVLVLEKCGEG
jgi:hypothetical protein